MTDKIIINKEDFTIGHHDTNWNYLILSMEGMKKHNIQSNDQLDEIYHQILEDAEKWSTEHVELVKMYYRLKQNIDNLDKQFELEEIEILEQTGLIRQYKEKLQKIKSLHNCASLIYKEKSMKILEEES